MPSSEDCISAQQQVREWAIAAMIEEGHLPHSAKAIVERMSYDEQVEKAEKVAGPIYRGAYSPY